MASADKNRTKRLTNVWDSLARLSIIPQWRIILHLVKQALRSLILSPVTFLACITTVSAALMVLGGVILLINNVSSSLQSSKGELSCRLYLTEKADEATAKRLIKELKEREGVDKVLFVNKKEALSELKTSLKKYAKLIDELDGENPLPVSIIVNSNEERVISEIVDKYSQEPLVEYVQYDQEVVTRMVSVVRFVRHAGWLTILALLFVTAVIIANTVRLTLATRNDEIVIMRLVGADSYFVKVPCLIEGGFYGLLGSLLGIFVLYGIWEGLLQVMGEVPIWIMLFPNLEFLSGGEIVLLTFASILVGIGSSYFAIWRLAEV